MECKATPMQKTAKSSKQSLKGLSKSAIVHKGMQSKANTKYTKVGSLASLTHTSMCVVSVASAYHLHKAQHNTPQHNTAQCTTMSTMQAAMGCPNCLKLPQIVPCTCFYSSPHFFSLPALNYFILLILALL